MFFTYALLAVIAYSIHSALVPKLYRELSDKLSAVFYRGICIAVSFSPALFLVPADKFQNLPASLALIALAAILAVIGTWAAVNSVNHLPVGIANTLLTALSNILIVSISVLFLGEVSSLLQLVLIALILASVLAFGLRRSHGNLPAAYNPVKGICFCLVFSIFTGTAYILLGLISRESDPILVGYLWESLIGVFAGVALIGRKLLNAKFKNIATFGEISFQNLKSMFFRSAPAGAGTAFYAMAMTQGSLAIASAVLNLSMVTTTLLAVFFYGERLSKLQWWLLALITLLVMALRLAG